MSGTLRYGIVGCSSMGRTHAEAVAGADGVELVACADVSADVARSLGEEHDCDPYADHAGMLDDAALDAVSVCTPNGTHAEIVSAAADRDVAVLCEKPLDVTPERVDDLVEACREAGVTLGGVFQRRTRPEMRLAREAVRGGDLGRLLIAETRVAWHRGDEYFDGWHGSADLDGGVLFTQALHGIDLLQWAVGDVARVSASFDTLHHDIAVPDTAVLGLEFADGARGQVSATTATRPGDPITLRFHGTERTLRVHDGGVDTYETADGPVEYELDPVATDGHAEQVRDFVDAVREGREPMIPPAEARKAVDVVFAAEEAARRDGWVAVDAVRESRE